MIYDYLVLVLGFQLEIFGVVGVDENVLLMDDLVILQVVYEYLEEWFKVYCISKDKNDLKIVVCGVGFIGIELLGELIQMLLRLQVKY